MRSTRSTRSTPRIVSLLRPAVPALLSLGLLSCATTNRPPPPETTGSFVFVEGVPGGVYVETIKASADVIFVDKAERKVTFRTSDGKKTTVTAGVGVANFDQIRVGDRLNVAVAEEIVIRMADEPAPYLPRDGAAALVALAPLGAKPGFLMADAAQVTATVTGIDQANRRATLRFPDGVSRTFPVRPDVDLTKRRVGEKVSVRSTVAIALMMEAQPPKG